MNSSLSILGDDDGRHRHHIHADSCSAGRWSSLKLPSQIKVADE